MASDEKQSDQKKKGKKQSDQKSSATSKEEMESFMAKLCARFEKLHLISRLLEEPEEQTQRSDELRRKSKKSRKLSNNVYEFFCDQPSTSEQSMPKSPSKKKQSESKPLGSSKNVTRTEEIDIVDLSEQTGTSWSDTSTVDKQSYIRNPDEPSTSTGLRTKVHVDQEALEKILRPAPNVTQEESEKIDKPKLSSLYGIHKKSRSSKDSDRTDAAELSPHKGARPKQTIKQTKDETTTSVDSKTDLENAKTKDIQGRAVFKLNESPEIQLIKSAPLKNVRAQRARERLRKKFEESTRTKGHGPNS
ncbi:hypothetical protein ACH3XW_32610 [Acanthocheilonema viteae]|uniref:Uncharacterized protein n=1 Tax=Acanthocheilonema viteae TaxID=6277 RepID=A0A498SNI7_ACAVI|nr:unnamed protein product [Acanthocheilonema viteae]